jgi:hypothetical protein
MIDLLLFGYRIARVQADEFVEPPTRIDLSAPKNWAAEDVEIDWADGPTTDWPIEETRVEVVEDLSDQIDLLLVAEGSAA